MAAERRHASTVRGIGAVYEGTACDGHGSFGGDAYANGTIYIPCTNGVQALAYDETAHTFTPLWQGPSDAFGSPIIADGLVWVLATGGFNGGGETLYGLDPATGATRYTEHLPSPVIDHFASPSAAGGRLFTASGETVTAYQIAKIIVPPIPVLRLPTTTSTTGHTSSNVPTLVHKRLHTGRRGRIRVTLRCAAKNGKCSKGTVTLIAEIAVVRHHGRHHRHIARHTVAITLARARFGPHRRGDFVVVLRLGHRGKALLRAHHYRLNVRVAIASPGEPARRVDAVLR
jgi:hypothetical protein